MRKKVYKKNLYYVYIMASKVSKVSKKEKSEKTTKPVKVVDEPAPVVVAKVEPVIVPVQVPDSPSTPTTPSATDPAHSLHDMFTSLNKAFQDLNSQVSLLKGEFRQIEKQVTREMRVLDKMNARRNKNKGNRAPSGFVKPTKISNDLAVFLGKEPGTMMARTDVTKQITAYIRANDLQDKTNGRLILADDKLKKLLNYDEKTVTDPKQQLSYFNLQRFLSGHFEKSA
jgi:upstream activation factor subunit UAF30